MTTVTDVLAELDRKGSDQTRETHMRHGAAPGQMSGVKIADLKIIATRKREQQELGLQWIHSKSDRAASTG